MLIVVFSLSVSASCCDDTRLCASLPLVRLRTCRTTAHPTRCYSSTSSEPQTFLRRSLFPRLVNPLSCTALFPTSECLPVLSYSNLVLSSSSLFLFPLVSHH